MPHTDYNISTSILRYMVSELLNECHCTRHGQSGRHQGGGEDRNPKCGGVRAFGISSIPSLLVFRVTGPPSAAVDCIPEVAPPRKRLPARSLCFHCGSFGRRTTRSRSEGRAVAGSELTIIVDCGATKFNRPQCPAP